MERKGVITFKGNPLTLVGPELKIGDTAPDFTVVDAGLQPKKLSDFKGQTIVISSVPSLDTPVCEIQTKKFNQEAANLNAKVLTISVDLPFAQKRFCDAFKIENVVVLSDYQNRNFGNAYGVWIKELALLARAVFVIVDGKIQYLEIVKEVTQEPNYKAALEKTGTARIPVGK